MSQPQNGWKIRYGLQQKQIPNEIMKPSYGQILTSTQQTKGAFQLIDEFKGRKIIGISGGFNRIFMFQQVDENQNVVTILHQQQEDLISMGSQSVVPIDQIVASLEGLKIVEISSGKYHNVIRTQDGHLFAYGKGQFGSLGLGGCMFSSIPKLISKLQNKKIISVACGAYHTLALSDIGDLYSWGRGFEGQLGLLLVNETASSPQYITNFYRYKKQKQYKMLRKKPIHKIACGAYHSLAIDNQGCIYTWGQAISGATGTGLKAKQPQPVKIDIIVDGQPRKILKVSGGFSHTLCLTQKGQLFSWGLNIKGQLGINDLPDGMESTQKRIAYKKMCLNPTQLKQTRDCTLLPKFVDICCGNSRSFAIDEEYNVWGWGGGILGFKDHFLERGPVKLTQGTENKRFHKIFANQDSLLLFAPLCPTYFKPGLVPSKGGTQLTFFGTGFTDTDHQSVVFKIGEMKQQIKLNFDKKTCTFYCKVINFQLLKMKVNQTIQCQISITLDGKNYIPYDKKLLIYPQKLSIQNIQPKSSTAHGATQCKIYMPLHQLILQYVQSITVGFKSNTKSDIQTKIQDWICVEGTYQQQKIYCKFPNIPYFDNDDPFYVVDISLNGQQFTNHPQTIRFYLISETSLSQTQGIQTDQPTITISGKGFFDTPFKQLTLQLHFTSQGNQYHCIKTTQCTWLKNQRKFTFKMPTIKWMLGQINVNQQKIIDARKSKVIIKLNLSKKDPIQVGKYQYLAPPPPQIPQETNKKDGKKDGKKDTKKDTKKAAKK